MELALQSSVATITFSALSKKIKMTRAELEAEQDNVEVRINQ